MSHQEEIAALEAKLRAREGLPGYKANVDALKKRIAEIKESQDGD